MNMFYTIRGSYCILEEYLYCLGSEPTGKVYVLHPHLTVKSSGPRSDKKRGLHGENIFNINLYKIFIFIWYYNWKWLSIALINTPRAVHLKRIFQLILSYPNNFSEFEICCKHKNVALLIGLRKPFGIRVNWNLLHKIYWKPLYTL